MNIHINFEISKLLKEKGFKGSTEANWWILQKDHHENYKKRLPVDESKIFFTKDSYELESKIQIDENTEHNVFHVLSSPTIAEVVMWLYEKHGIWIECLHRGDMGDFTFKISKLKKGWRTKPHYIHESGYNSPTEAYEDAITYTLNNLI